MDAFSTPILSVATACSKLLEGDLYEDELNELPDLFLPGTDGEYVNGPSIVSPEATTAVLEAVINQSDGLAMEGVKTPELPDNHVDSQAQDSPNTYQRQMEMEFHNWATSRKVKATQESNVQAPLPCKPLLLPKQPPQLFGRKISLPNDPAPMAVPCSQTVHQGNKREKQNFNAALAPIAPKVTSTPALVLAPSAPTTRVPVLEITPATSGISGSCLQPNEPVFPPPQTPSVPLVMGDNETPKDKSKKRNSGEIETNATEANIQPKGKGKPRQRRYKRRDPSMTEEEVDQEHRQRNKEHAKNTRLRKKAYVEALKESLNSFVDQRDEDHRNAEIEQKVKMQNRQVRFDVMQTFLRLRGRKRDNNNKRDKALWTSILDDSVTLFRPDRPGSSQIEVVVRGISAVISDPGEVDLLFLDNPTFAGQHKAPKLVGQNATISIENDCDRSSLLMDGCTCIMQWKGITSGATTLGYPSELPLAGTLRARFNPKTNMIVSAALHYDTGALREIRGTLCEVAAA